MQIIALLLKFVSQTERMLNLGMNEMLDAICNL